MFRVISTINDSPAAHGGRSLPMGWIYWRKCMKYTWRGTPRIVLSRDASGWDFFQIWHLASHTGNLPILGNHSRGGPLSFYNFWQVAKISWHAANNTPPDPPWSSIVTHIAPVTKIGLEKAHFHGYLTLTLDLWPWNVKNQRAAIETYLHTENEALRSNGLSSTGVH